MSEYIAGRAARMNRMHDRIIGTNGLDRDAESEANRLAEEIAIELQRGGLSGNVFDRVVQRMDGTKPLDTGSAATPKERVPTGSESERALSGREARDELMRKRQPPGPISGRLARLDLARRLRMWREEEKLQRPGVGAYRTPGRPL
jgi:hypothetical protein